MSELINKNNIQIIEKVSDWQEAIKLAVRPLVDNGYCYEEYINNIIKNTLEMGPYYVLCENLALLHARCDQGAIKKQLGVTLLKEPVKFKADGYDVRILVTLVAEDSESHMQAIQAVANIFSDSNKVEQILSAKNTDQIYDYFIEAMTD